MALELERREVRQTRLAGGGRSWHFSGWELVLLDEPFLRPPTRSLCPPLGAGQSIGSIARMMLSFPPDRGAHPAQCRSNILHLDGRRGVCFVQGQVLLARSHLQLKFLGCRQRALFLPQMLRDTMCKEVWHIQQPAPNKACTRRWGVCAFSSLFHASAFSQWTASPSPPQRE